MRRLIILLTATIPMAGAACAEVRADGGQIRARERHGDYLVTVFTSPTPLRSGPIDVSVLFQDAATGRTLGDVEVVVELAARGDAHPSIRQSLTADQATNKLLRAAKIELPRPGWWDVRIEFALPNRSAEIRFSMDAAAPLPPWLSVWPWFGWPVVAVLVFAMHRSLVARRQTLAHRRSDRNVRGTAQVATS